MIILGIETSCDETALALIETRGTHNPGGNSTDPALFECRVIESLVHSQAELHSAYGGVYPSLAKREHGKNLVPVLADLIQKSQISTKSSLTAEQFAARVDDFKKELGGQNPELLQSLEGADFLKKIPDIDAIAVTEGPGLEPALWVGINFARFLSTLWGVPVIPVDHMEGHIVGSLLESDTPSGSWQKLKELPLPAISLLISGGHTELVKIDSIGSYQVIGHTKDDAVGEAFDKVARLLKLPYPGGPHVSMLAAEARRDNIPAPVKLPRPMLTSGDLLFSFSGLKTAVLYAIQKHGTDSKGNVDDIFKKGLAREFEDAVSDTLDSKLRTAIEQTTAQSIIVGGGVSANSLLHERFEATAKAYGVPLFMPLRHISGDNALMIALSGALTGKTKALSSFRADGTKKIGAK